MVLANILCILFHFGVSVTADIVPIIYTCNILIIAVSGLTYYGMYSVSLSVSPSDCTCSNSVRKPQMGMWP